MFINILENPKSIVYTVIKVTKNSVGVKTLVIKQQ